MNWKAEILGQLLDEEWHTAPKVAAALGIGLSNASELLRRYHVQGLVRRRVRRRCFPRGPYAYQVTEKGVERYQWLTDPGKQGGVAWPGAEPLLTPERRPLDFYHGPPEGRRGYSPRWHYGKPGWRGAPPEDEPSTKAQGGWEERLRRLRARVEEQLADIRQQVAGKEAKKRTETILGTRGHPVVVPYDPVLMDALRRRLEARARKAEREAMMAGMVALPGGGQQASLGKLLEPLVKPLQDQVKAFREAVAGLGEMVRQIEAETLRRSVDELREEARRARELAAARQEKRLAEYLRVAGNELQDALQRAGQDMKEGIQDLGHRLASIRTGQQVLPRKERLRSLAEIAAIMEAEDALLERLGGKGGEISPKAP